MIPIRMGSFEKACFILRWTLSIISIGSGKRITSLPIRWMKTLRVLTTIGPLQVLF
ncbi:hypothetical protein PSHT_02085 [Puccinia striiformis]|uniref:Uncharacterized protein n=2 Tax=Puccinia striiformis TaxID=27350 RepID=A0A2S4UJM1_9BASI|nr:hypothetical protein PSTT_15127 [Puccinia striiformis]POW21701.1 hypothetical protein PSHT_02085 [Puccinia striiformis]